MTRRQTLSPSSTIILQRYIPLSKSMHRRFSQVLIRLHKRQLHARITSGRPTTTLPKKRHFSTIRCYMRNKLRTPTNAAAYFLLLVDGQQADSNPNVADARVLPGCQQPKSLFNFISIKVSKPKYCSPNINLLSSTGKKVMSSIG